MANRIMGQELLEMRIDTKDGRRGIEQVAVKQSRNRRVVSNELNPPFFMVFISMLQLAIFIYYAFRTEEPITFTGPVPFGSKLIYNPYRRYEVWRFLTYTFIHAGFWHVTFNLLIQLAVGIPLEMVHKSQAIFIIYLGGVIGGALGNSIADPYSYLVGASGGCYALIAAHLSNLIINWNELKYACLKLLALLSFTAYDFGTAVYERHFKVDNVSYKTTYGSHIAGGACGLLLGLIFLKNIRVHKWEEMVSRTASCVFLFSINLAILFNILKTDYFPMPDRRDLIWPMNPFARDREY